MTFKDWNDGDVLYAADLEGDYIETAKYSVISRLLNHNNSSQTFATDTADTKTNFAYNSNKQYGYTCLGTNAGILISAVKNADTSYYKIVNAWCNWRKYVFTVYDEITDSSLDTNLWQTDDGAVTEDANNISVTNAKYLRTHTTNGNFYNTDYIIMFKGGCNGRSGATGNISVTDGSTDVNVVSTAFGGPQNNVAEYIFKFNATAKTVDAWSNGSLISGSPFDLSGLTSVWSIKLYIGGDPATSSVMYYLRKITGSETTTSTETFSADNKSNYTSVSSRKYVSIDSANQGWQMYAKITSTPASGEGIHVERVDFQGFNGEE